MTVQSTLRILTLAALGVCAGTAGATVVNVGTSGSLDAIPDGSFINVGIDSVFVPQLGVVATNSVSKTFDSLWSWSDSTVTVNAVTFMGTDFRALETSTVNYAGGVNPALEVVAYDDATINFTGGVIGKLATGGGTGTGGSATMSGGTVMDVVTCAGGSVAITGGTFGTPTYGLPFSFISLVPGGIAFSGTGIVATYVELGLEENYGFGGNVWQLSGTLANGGSVNGLWMIDVGISDPTVIVNYTGVTIYRADLPPVADAGMDVSVNEGDPVMLAGTGSDPDGDAISYSWVQVAGPTVSPFLGANTANPNFTAPSVLGSVASTPSETFSFELTVTANGQSATDTVDVIVSNVDQPPVANAGTDIAVNEGDPVMLAGTGSDPDGDDVTFSWAQVAGPTVGSFVGADTANPTFTAPSVLGSVASAPFETFSFELTVTANGQSATDTVNVFVCNVDQPPVADAGAGYSVDEGYAVQLDGTASIDPDGDAVTYLWTQQPGGHMVTLAGATTAQPTFTSPYVALGGETLSFLLTVTANGQSAIDVVSITVVNINHVPVASAGPPQTVVEGGFVTLHGEGSFDVDNDSFSYAWVQVSGTPALGLTGDDTVNPTFVAPSVGSSGGSLVFNLVVDDGYPWDAPANGHSLSDVLSSVTITVTNVNGIPIANAGPDSAVNELTTATLNGAASSDPDGDTLTYSWVQVGGPPVTLTGPSSATPSFQAPSVNSCGSTVLTFRLTVEDGFGGTNFDQVVVQVQNVIQPPSVSCARPSDGLLWPPNHKMVCIGIEGISSRYGSGVSIAITSVTQDEPTNGLGDGDTAIDAIIKPNGKVLLRAERQGTGNGRVYHVHFTATNSGGSTSGVVKVVVPHSKHSTAVDGGELYISTQ